MENGFREGGFASRSLIRGWSNESKMGIWYSEYDGLSFLFLFFFSSLPSSHMHANYLPDRSRDPLSLSVSFVFKANKYLRQRLRNRETSSIKRNRISLLACPVKLSFTLWRSKILVQKTFVVKF